MEVFPMSHSSIEWCSFPDISRHEHHLLPNGRMTAFTAESFLSRFLEPNVWSQGRPPRHHHPSLFLHSPELIKSSCFKEPAALMENVMCARLRVRGLCVWCSWDLPLNFLFFLLGTQASAERFCYEKLNVEGTERGNCGHEGNRWVPCVKQWVIEEVSLPHNALPFPPTMYIITQGRQLVKVP